MKIPDMKNIIIKIKDTSNGFNRRLDTIEEKFNDLKVESTENIHIEA